MKTLENAKELSTHETPKNYYDYILQSYDLDYETIHSEFLDNLVIGENDSDISDFVEDDSENYSEKDGSKYYKATKIKNINQKCVRNFFDELQEDDIYKPLLQIKVMNENKKEKNIKKNVVEKNNLTSARKKMTIEENNEMPNDKKNKINNYEKEIIKYNVKTLGKEKKLINYKKYNYFNDPLSNYNIFTTKYELRKFYQKRFKDFHPFLQTFNPKFLKKENIDKKIFRRFRKYVKKLYKKKSNSPIFSKNEEFWELFYFQNLLPPVKVTTKDNVELIFKSISNQYLIWLFEQEGIPTLFKNFISDEKNSIMTNFIIEYDLENSPEKDIIEKLDQYLDCIPDIYETKEINEKEKILEDEKEIETTNFLSNTNEKEEDENDKNANPFAINFADYIGKKRFQEVNYDNYYICRNLC